jgi:hypothetical protein
MAMSVAFLDVTQFAAYSRFTQTPNYIDSDAPPIKFSLWLTFRSVILCSWMTNDTGWHEKFHLLPSMSILAEGKVGLRGIFVA